ncbi:MAG TPA: FMN-binding negative transcriptional regulator [Ktedonobacterales bacterium]|jgi:transcriptional regulator
MYTPPAFREDDLAKLHELMRSNSFAILVTHEDGAPLATHLPFLLDAERGPYGTLLGHMSRANSQWHAFLSGQQALAIFQGPHAYISPSWYKPEAGNVPTWNYAAVHAYGVPKIIEDETRLAALLHASVGTFEAGFEHPWTLDMPNDLFHSKVKGIVAFEMEITRLEGKLKMSQNRPEADQENVARILSQSEDATTASVGALMQQVQQTSKA